MLEALVPGTDTDAGAVRVALITGLPGVGKAALAVRFAHRTVTRYQDGQIYVEPAP